MFCEPINKTDPKPRKNYCNFLFNGYLFIGIKYTEDIRRSMSDSEITVTAVISVLYFGGDQNNGIHFM